MFLHFKFNDRWKDIGIFKGLLIPLPRRETHCVPKWTRLVLVHGSGAQDWRFENVTLNLYIQKRKERTYRVEFPFHHTLSQPDNTVEQTFTGAIFERGKYIWKFEFLVELKVTYKSAIQCWLNSILNGEMEILHFMYALSFSVCINLESHFQISSPELLSCFIGHSALFIV